MAFDPPSTSPIGPARIIARIFFIFAIVYDTFSLIAYAFIPNLHKLAFPMLGGHRMLPPFADLRWVTSLSECGVNLEDLAQGKVFGCDPYGRGGGLGYPPISVEVARFLNVQGAHTGIIGFAMGMAMIGILLSLLIWHLRTGWLRDFFGSLILMSFPVQQALERSNIDVVIFVLLTSLAALLASSRRWAIPLVGFISWLTVAIKLYPVAGILVWVGVSILRRPRFNWLRTASLVGASLGLASALPWFLNFGKGAAQPPAGFVSHGFIFPLPLDQLTSRAPIFGKILEIVPQPLIVSVVLASTLFWCVRVRIYGRLEMQFDQRADGYSKRFLGIMPSLLGSVWLGCYFLSGSFDYRLILALPAFIFLLSLFDLVSLNSPISLLPFLIVLAFSGFASFLLPLSEFSSFLPINLRPLLLLSDLFLMPFVAASIISVVLPLPFAKNSEPRF